MANDPHRISVKDAAALTLRWRRNRPPDSINGARFDRVTFDRLLSQPGCEGIRIYLGLHDPADPSVPKGQSMWTYVIIGTDAQGNDIIPPQSAMTDEGGGDPGQNPVLCPPSCGEPDPLNDPP
jgi:hypothetical protein